MAKQKTLVENLLTENRYWTFWSLDWTKKIDVKWGGKTKFKKVKEAIAKQLGPQFGYERQVELKEPQLTFA